MYHCRCRVLFDRICFKCVFCTILVRASVILVLYYTIRYDECLQLDLVEGVNNDVLISSVVNAGHLFLQQPMHPTYQSLTLLNLNMNQVYNSPEAPVVLEPIKGTSSRVESSRDDKYSYICTTYYVSTSTSYSYMYEYVRMIRIDD